MRDESREDRPMNRGMRSRRKLSSFGPAEGFSWIALFGVTAFGCGGKDDIGGSGDGDGDIEGAGGSGAASGDGDNTGGTVGTGGATTGGGNDSCSFETCGGACVDTQTDNLNCGDCGEVCEEHHACQVGDCTRVSCPNSLTVCDFPVAST